MITWEQLDTNSDQTLCYRAKVPGGWLVRVTNIGEVDSIAVTFYPDPQHKWDGSSLR